MSAPGELPDTLELQGAAGELAAEETAAQGRPVYRRPSGDLLFPTGRVLVRFGKGDRVDAHADELAGAGYELDQALGFAPQAGYVRAAGGDAAAGLAGIERLRTLAGVEHVEPEVQMERGAR
jgi:hypothetical protein